jgi:hypothetical protein
VRLVCGHIPVVREVQPWDTGTRASSRSSVVVERRDGGSEDGSARSTWQTVGKSPMCRGIYVRGMDLSLVRVASILKADLPIYALMFFPDTVVTPFTSDYISGYLSLCPSPGDAVLSFGPMDSLLTPAQHYHPTRLYNLFPHPAQDAGEKRRYIAMLTSR